MYVLGFKPLAIPNKKYSSFVIYDKTNINVANMTYRQTFLISSMRKIFYKILQTTYVNN